jgi:hypothetical protein
MELHNENITYTLHQIQSEWSRHGELHGQDSMHGGEGTSHRNLVAKLEGEKPLGRPSRKWENNMKTDPREKRWLDWINLTQDRG